MSVNNGSSEENNKNTIDQYFNTFYEVPKDSDSSPMQGDIFIPSHEPEGNIKELGIVVISNSCDISNKELQFIAYIPIYRLERIFDQKKVDNERRLKKVISQNHQYFFYFPRYNDLISDNGAIALFQNIRTLRTEDFKENYRVPKLRIVPPIRDKLSAKIARLFNRIPINHPEDCIIRSWLIEKGIISDEGFEDIKKRIESEAHIKLHTILTEFESIRKIKGKYLVEFLSNNPSHGKELQKALEELSKLLKLHE